jgi:hypothetical protein
MPMNAAVSAFSSRKRATSASAAMLHPNPCNDIGIARAAGAGLRQAVVGESDRHLAREIAERLFVQVPTGRLVLDIQPRRDCGDVQLRSGSDLPPTRPNR